MNRLFELTIIDNKIWVHYDYNLGHTFGGGLISPDKNLFYVNISKNASSQLKSTLGQYNWSSANYKNNSNTKSIVILRDPTDRWLSGMAEFLVGNYSSMGNYNANLSLDEIEVAMNTKMFQNLIFNFVIFDGHTLPQSCYLNGLNLDDIAFFYFDKNTIPKILKYLGLPSTTGKTNDALTNPKKTFIIQKLKRILENNLTLQKQIDVNYHADHQLFDKVTFN